MEVLQDGFLKIFQQIDRYDSEKSSLYTWMRTIMVRTSIDFLRRRSKRHEAVEWMVLDIAVAFSANGDPEMPDWSDEELLQE